ncbi:MAG: ABC transporter permease [Planctomycetota bacterium]|nr:ABC transporter permease [Planctomycetota bacterium]
MELNAEWTIHSPNSSVTRAPNLLGRMVRDFLDARDLAWRLFVRDVSARYRQSLLGYLWAFLPPVVLTLSFVLAGQASILNTAGTSLPFAAFALIGTVLWQTFSESINGPVQAVTQSKPLLARIRFPYEAIVLAKVGELLFSLTIRLTLVCGVLLWFGIVPPWTAFAAVLPIAVLILFGTAIGMMLAPLGGLYDDIAWTLTLALSLWFFLTPVVYEQPAAGSIIETANLLNPVAPLLQTARQLLSGGELTHLIDAGIVTLITLPLFVAGWIFFRSSLAFAIERINA